MDLNSISPAYGNVLYFMLGALVLFLLLFVTGLWRAGWGRKPGMGRPISVRTIRAYEATREGLARAAETGQALHTSPGTGLISGGGVNAASTLAGMNVVESMGRVAAITGAPVIATTNGAVTYALADNALRRGYRRAGWTSDTESGGVRFITHADAVTYAAHVADVAEQAHVSQAVMAGYFGPEVLLITEAQRRTNAQQIIGSSNPESLAMLHITADHTLIGEEIFASGAYLEHRTSHLASLLAQDGLRYAVIIMIIIGFILVNVLGKNWQSLVNLYP
ncbi:MAG: hypothetical protein M3014_14835 [Chloroflexota bacterium]|nr:hypothetical protein [Chloroflexota bacterium]